MSQSLADDRRGSNVTTTLPFEAYVSDAFLAAERDKVFSRSWQYVGHTGDLPTLGSRPVSVNGVPVVVTRHGEGTVNAFVNVCSHRGSIVCHAVSEAEVLRCPYHAWRYGLDGTLLTAPRSDREESFDAEPLGLERLPVGMWGPFIFVAPGHDVPPFASFLGELPSLVADAGIDVDALVFNRRSRSTIAANWKVCVENFLECYHCQVAHIDFSRTIDTTIDAYQLSAQPTFSTQIGPTRADTEAVLDLAGPIKRSQFHLLYPNTVINILPGHPNLSIGPINPQSPGVTDRFLDYFFTQEVTDEWVEAMIAFDDQVGAEDVTLVENVHLGMTARPARRGNLFMESEHLIARFDAWVAQRLAETASAE